MTVYSGVLQKRTALASVSSGTGIGAHWPPKVNVFLLAVVIIMSLGYVLMANLIISQRYVLESRRARFDQISVSSVESGPAIGGDDELNALLIFARNTGMVEAKDTAVILNDSDFALSGADR